ncbi:MAG: hypothetical protein CMH32_01280 [Micavibrio sp.]|nr:hypothetical protein [Micavibrio sp.]HCK31964.1 hypothetical protein [Rhodospirillaceae bacterium]|tara:strand:+ start:162 stop:1604 length:1443 start_codon:yes stop_codon:yes gene_type:complete
MRKAPAIFSVDLIQQEDGTFKVLELNRGLDSGYEGYRMATGGEEAGADLWKNSLKPLIFDFADANKMHVKWYGKEHMLGRSKPIRELKDPDKLRNALMVGDVITDEFCTLADKTNSALLDGYSVLWAAYFDKAFFARLAERIDSLGRYTPKQKVYGHMEEWDALVERIKEDFKGVEELVLKDASSCAGHNVYFIRMSDLKAGQETPNILWARKRFTDTKFGSDSISSNSSRCQMSHQMFPHFVVQECVKAKLVPDLTRDWEAEIRAYEENRDNPEASVGKIGANPYVDMNKFYRPVIRAVVSAVPSNEGSDAAYDFKIHGTYYKYPFKPVTGLDDFNEDCLLSDVTSRRDGPSAALLEEDIQKQLEAFIQEDLAPSVAAIMDMSIDNVVKDLLRSEDRADHLLGLNMLLDPQYFWGDEIILDQEIYDLTHKVLASDMDLQIRSAVYLINADQTVKPVGPVKQMVTGIVLKFTPQLRSLTL